MGFRTAPTHFAGAETQMYIVSTDIQSFPDDWVVETAIYRERDLREPFLLVQNGALHFYFFELGTNPISFDPNFPLRMSRMGFANWSSPQEWGHKGECNWQFNTNENLSFALSFSGTEGVTSFGNVKLFLNQSSDGIIWEPVNAEKTVLYDNGGISEVRLLMLFNTFLMAFEITPFNPNSTIFTQVLYYHKVGWAFDLFGDIWGVGRNEDGDSSGWGSRTFRTFDGKLSDWVWLSGNKVSSV